MWPLLALLVFAVAHYAYRYVLQVSEDATSPRYHDTPPALSLLKDAALALFLLATLWRFTARRLRFARRHALLFQLAVAVHLWALISVVVHVLNGEAFASALLAYRYLWLYSAMIPLVLLLPRERAHVTLRLLARALLPLLSVFWLLTVWLYVARGRLPALSYPGNVRFGGILDDPNGYGVLCVFLLAALWGRVRWPWLLALLVMILGTRSLSAALSLLVFTLVALWPRAARFVTAHVNRRHPAPLQLRIRRALFLRLAFYAAVLPPVAGVAFYAWVRISAALGSWWSAKQGSLEAHASDVPRALAQLGERNALELLFGGGGFSENLYLYALLNFGVFGLTLLLLLAGLLVVSALTSCDPLAYRLGAWGVSVLAASFAIPYLQVYPVNLLFWTGLTLAVSGASVRPRGASGVNG